MGFNKRFITFDRTYNALIENDLRGYYGKSDMLDFEDTTSSAVYEMYVQGLNEEEILQIIQNEKNEKNNSGY